MAPDRTRFCGHCGASDPSGPHRSLGGPVAILVTLVWLFVALFFLNSPRDGGPRQTLFVYSLAYVAPAVLILIVALVRVRKSGNITIGPGVAFLIAVTWFASSLLLLSSPRQGSELGLAWLAFTLAIFGAWCGLLVPTAVRIWSKLRLVGLSTIAAYLLPLPLLVISCVALESVEAPEQARLRLSEAQLMSHIQEYQSSGVSPETRLVGLLRVERTYEREECVMLQLGAPPVFLRSNYRNEYGLAYCPAGKSPTPGGPMAIWFDRLWGNWWTYETHLS